ncbi:MAG: hypothetical protein AAF270_07630 [Pseudomonadota bacterium]
MNDETHYDRDWDRDTQKRAALIWISFLVAAAMTLVFFAFVDPIVLVDQINHKLLHNREVGYSIGFFFFWSGCLACGWLCLRLTRRKRQLPRRTGRAGPSND